MELFRHVNHVMRLVTHVPIHQLMTVLVVIPNTENTYIMDHVLNHALTELSPMLILEAVKPVTPHVQLVTQLITMNVSLVYLDITIMNQHVL